ncbi:SPFH domain-containing protein [Photobacterium sp. DNB23_23_1]|uniref:Paraslipin n=1 Tax=Photobacterium pectinilyticum TaxID=2906793 RepID=A0ABT1N878_9GAMM|nr:slipin family protein [Photobacterium sp. ZSDE20]MCQ1060960.1 paraslipin [Photobacterium sp. ZSDE20]MDD1828896.1 paraslipin [Photobacterium sp. ZSDE20]
MDISFIIQMALVALVVITISRSVRFVPQNQAWIVERFGKYQGTKEAGLNFLIPMIDAVAAKQSLKEQAYDVPSQSAITKDNIQLIVDGILYFRVLDAYKATYGVEDYVFAVTQLAQTTMRSEIGKIELDQTFEGREALNSKIVNMINEATVSWGVTVLRYELSNITPPESVMSSMESQMRAERERRAKILESNGQKEAQINVAEGEKQSRVLAAEAEKQEQVLAAEGEAQALIAVANAQAEALRLVGEAAATETGQKAVELELATKAIEAKRAIAKESSVVLLPDSSTEAGSLVAQATTILSAMKK